MPIARLSLLAFTAMLVFVPIAAPCRVDTAPRGSPTSCGAAWQPVGPRLVPLEPGAVLAYQRVEPATPAVVLEYVAPSGARSPLVRISPARMLDVVGRGRVVRIVCLDTSSQAVSIVSLDLRRLTFDEPAGPHSDASIPLPIDLRAHSVRSPGMTCSVTLLELAIPDVPGSLDLYCLDEARPLRLMLFDLPDLPEPVLEAALQVHLPEEPNPLPIILRATSPVPGVPSPLDLSSRRGARTTVDRPWQNVGPTAASMLAWWADAEELRFLILTNAGPLSTYQSLRADGNASYPPDLIIEAMRIALDNQ